MKQEQKAYQHSKWTQQSACDAQVWSEEGLEKNEEVTQQQNDFLWHTSGQVVGIHGDKVKRSERWEKTERYKRKGNPRLSEGSRLELKTCPWKPKNMPKVANSTEQGGPAILQLVSDADGAKTWKKKRRSSFEVGVEGWSQETVLRRGAQSSLATCVAWVAS